MAFTGDQITELVDLIQNSGSIHAVEIARHFGFPTDNNQVEARKMIIEAIDYGHIIMSNTHYGYKIPDNKEEFVGYIESLEGRINKLERRKELLIDNWNTTTDDAI